MIVELFYYSVILIIVFTLLKRFNKKLSYTHRSILITIMIFFTLSQVIKDHRYSYPLTNWTMYSSPYPSLFYHEFLILTDKGEYHYPFIKFTKSSTRAFMRKQTELLNSSISESTDEILNKNIEALLLVYSKHYPNQKIKRLDINTVHFKLGMRDTKNLVRYNQYTFENAAQ